eukprot:5204553-Pyramimonas_sp.AAC.1
MSGAALPLLLRVRSFRRGQPPSLGWVVLDPELLLDCLLVRPLSLWSPDRGLRRDEPAPKLRLGT